MIQHALNRGRVHWGDVTGFEILSVMISAEATAAVFRDEPQESQTDALLAYEPTVHSGSSP